MSLTWVFLLLFFIAPPAFAHTGHGTHRTLSATVVTGGIDVTLSGAQEGFELYGCNYPAGGTACTLTTLDATNRLSGWVNNSANTFEHRSLNSGTVYLYKAIEYESSGTHQTNQASATTPNAPALDASNISGTGATLTLTNHSGNWHYKKTAPTPVGNCSGAQTGSSVNLSSLTAGTSYTYKAYSDSACSTELASETFTTLSPALDASSISDTTATLTLSNHSGNWHYKKTAPTPVGTCSGAQTGSIVNLSNLTAGTSYTYEAYSDSACATELASETFTTALQITLTATAGQGKVDLSWTSISGAAGYDLYFCEGASCTVPTSGSTGNLGWITSGTTFAHTGLSTSTTYRYQVTHYVDGTARSNVASATTPNAPALDASSISDTAATLTLTNHIGNWYYKKTAPTPAGACSGAQTGSIVNLSSLTAGTSYTYKAYSDSSCLTELDSETFTTLYDLNLRVVSANASAITLTWDNHADVLSTSGYDVYRCTVQSECATSPPAGSNTVYLSWVPKPGGNTITLVDDDGTESGGNASPITPGTTYHYAVQGYISGGDTGFWRVSATAGAPPPPPPPSKPTGLTITSVSAEAVSLRWKSSSGSGEGARYGVYRCTVPEGKSTCEPYDDLWLAYLDNSNTYTDTEVTPGETYRYQVAADNLQRENLSRAVTVTVGAQMSEMVPSPTGLTVTETTESLVRLSWTAPEDDGKGPIQAIDIYRCNVGRSPDCSEFLHLASSNPVLTEFRDNEVEPDTTYRYVIASYRSAKEVSPWSNQVTATTKRGRYASPTDLTVTATYRNAISLSWTAPAEGILAYNVYRCIVQTGETTCEPAWHAWVANEGDAPPAPTSYTDTGGETGGIFKNVTYLYVVAASYPPSHRTGDRSEAVKATAGGGRFRPEQEQSMIPPAPTNLAATPGNEQITLTWTPPAGTVTGWELLIRTDTDTGSWMSITPSGTTTKSYTVTGLTNGVQYTFLVRAVNGTLKGAPAGRRGPATVPSLNAGEFEASFEAGHQWFRQDVLPALSGNTTWHSIAWKGERIQQHILINNVPSNSRISLVPSDLTNAENHTIPSSAVSFRYPRFVAGHTEARSCSKDYQEENTTAYLSDALFSEPTQALPPSWPELVWMSVDIPSDVPTGEYSGTVSVRAVSATAIDSTELHFSIQVASWTMPDNADRQFHLDLWQFPVSVLDRYNDANPGDRIKIWSDEHYALLEPTYRYLADLGQRTATTYIKEGALGAPSMIQWTLKRDGSWGYDYSVFDDYVERLASWGLDEQISAFSPVGWNEGDIPYWDEANQRKEIFSAGVGSPDWNTRWQHFLTDFRAHLLEKEWFDKTVLYLDESSEEDVQAVIDLVGGIDENWKIGLAYIGYGHDGPGEHVLSRLYDGSGSMALVGTTYVDTGLITGETYRYAVDAVNDRASAASSPVTVAAQVPAVPGEPIDLTALNTSGIQLNWTAPAMTGSSALTGYNVYRCVDETASCTPAWFDSVTSGTTYTDPYVVANTAYRYTVEACNGTGCGNQAGEITVMSGDTVNEQSVETDDMAEPGQTPQNQAVPEVPTGLTAFAASATAIQLSWEGSAVKGFDVYRCVGSQTCGPVTYTGWAYADNYTPDPDRISTYYTSCVQPRPNSFVAAAADPTDVGALAWHALQRRQDGYLRWAFDNWQSSDPLDVREGAFTAGDFSLVYRSGNDRGMTVVPSIRSEMLRDGIEDFEKIQVLRNRLSACGENALASRWLDRLERTVDTFSAAALMAGRAGDLISRAHDRLGEISLQLTPDMCR